MQVLCDFYNMHLGRKENVFATDTERNYLIKFLERHCPKIVLDGQKGLPNQNFTLIQYERRGGKNWWRWRKLNLCLKAS